MRSAFLAKRLVCRISVYRSFSKMSFERLPTFAKPTNYKIDLKPDLGTFKFEGQQTVQLDLESATDYLKLYASKLEIRNVCVKSGDAEHSDLPLEYDEKWETVKINFPKQLGAGKATLSMDFTGTLNDKMHGFYRSAYKTEKGQEKHMASTQFESTYARVCFPCWDEPVYKATFDLSLTVKSDLTALSNMNVTSENVLSDGWKKVQFAQTPIMSSYLVAFAVGDFAYLEDKTADGVVVRTYALPEKVQHLKFALEVAVKGINFYNEFFGIPYPLPKCDLIAIPDFSMGAMENWGLITYREILILLDPARSSKSIKIHIALTISHELAHMWFGNLVTMKWWQDLWLKEGFANFVMYLFTAKNYPEFKVWELFVCDEIESAFALDSLRSSHPIEIQIGNPNELEEYYDSITYDKACTINRMLFFHLGDETFRKGMHLYLDKFKYSNAITTDLWEALGTASGTDVCSLMSSWTGQMGFPVLSVQSKRDGQKVILDIEQKRFLADGSQDSSNPTWRIPISVSTSQDPTNPAFKLMLQKQNQRVELEGVKVDQWIKLNAGFTGFYRVQYPPDMLEALVPAMNEHKLNSVDRYNILTDIFALVRAGCVPADQYMSVLSACVNESEYVVWSKISSSLGQFANVMARTDSSKAFDAFVHKICAPLAEKLGWKAIEGESISQQQLRALVLGRLSRAQHQPTIDQARELFKKYLEGEEIVPDLRAVVFRAITRYGGIDGFEAIKKVLETSTFSEVQNNCIASLGASDDREIQLKALDYAMDPAHVRPQDLMRVFFGVASSVTGQETAWEFFKTNFDKLIEKYGSANSSLFHHCLSLSISNHCSEESAKALEDFISPTPHAKTLERIVKQTCEEIRLNATMLKRDAPVIEKWLKENGF